MTNKKNVMIVCLVIAIAAVLGGPAIVNAYTGVNESAEEESKDDNINYYLTPDQYEDIRLASQETTEYREKGEDKYAELSGHTIVQNGTEYSFGYCVNYNTDNMSMVDTITHDEKMTNVENLSTCGANIQKDIKGIQYNIGLDVMGKDYYVSKGVKGEERYFYTYDENKVTKNPFEGEQKLTQKEYKENEQQLKNLLEEIGCKTFPKTEKEVIKTFLPDNLWQSDKY